MTLTTVWWGATTASDQYVISQYYDNVASPSTLLIYRNGKQ
jgi:hypothetical protein